MVYEMTENLQNDVTPVFGLTRSQLIPIISNAVLNETVESFDISIEHQVQGYYGYQAEKIIPTFTYTTATGNAGKITIFIKKFYRKGPAEAHNYVLLEKHQAPIPRMYGTLTDVDQREILFLEYLVPIADNEKFLSDADQFHQFIDLAAHFNAIQLSQEFADQLSNLDISNRLIGAGSVLNKIWSLACKGELGNTLRQFCSSSEDKLKQLQMLIKRLIEPIERMELGLSHTDFYSENTGWRWKTGELLMIDLEFVGFAPKFFDVAGWIGAPDDIQPRCCQRRELAQYYLEQYARYGGFPMTLEQFLDEVHTLWMAGELRMLGWSLGRAVDGQVDWTNDQEEGQRLYRDGLYKVLNDLLQGAKFEEGYAGSSI
jgi:hypothetical protein